MRWRLQTNNKTVDVILKEIKDSSFIFEIDGKTYKLSDPKVFPFSIQTPEINLAIESWSKNKWRAVNGASTYNVESVGFGKSNTEDQGAIVSQMPGRILKVFVKAGDAVSANQTLLIVEAMKMENEIRAINSTTVKEIFVKEGDSIEAGVLLIRFQS